MFTASSVFFDHRLNLTINGKQQTGSRWELGCLFDHVRISGISTSPGDGEDIVVVFFHAIKSFSIFPIAELIETQNI
jgi:hypothetical protein